MITNWRIQALTGYKPITNIYIDLSIAEGMGIQFVQDTVVSSFWKWLKNYKLLTELCMALIWKAMEHQNDSYGDLYSDAYHELYSYSLRYLKGNELAYFIKSAD